MRLRSNPLIYEINTLVWLRELSLGQDKQLTLSDVPDNIWDELGKMNIDAIWLMGVWTRSPECIKISGTNQNNLADFRKALPDFEASDNAGSPYSVREYSVDPAFGSNEGLAVARKKLSERNIALILDFVPNHLAFDHPWVSSHPEFFISGSRDDLVKDPVTFKEWDQKILACGKDPYYPAWEDVVQVNAFHPGLREEVIQTLNRIALQCDGVRCDMAMLMVSEVFKKTWGDLASEVPAEEYWEEVIRQVRKNNPDFTFIAEAYWDMEYTLQQNGFDYCYDKRLYDRLKGGNAEAVRLHLTAGLAYQSGLIRFLENHDEHRAAEAFPGDKSKAAALVTFTVPGARLFHEGQAQGKKVHLPVFLRRRPDEGIDTQTEIFYGNLLEIIRDETFHRGSWTLCRTGGWDDNNSCIHILSWYWQFESKLFIIAVNYRSQPSQGLVQLPDIDLAGHDWRLVDLITQDHFIRNGDEISANGLYVGLGPWGFHFFQMFRMV